MADIRKILGDLDDATVKEILTLEPSLADLEDVVICMAGDHDVLAKRWGNRPASLLVVEGIGCCASG